MSGSRFVHVGTPSGDFKEWTTTVVGFHRFADLTTTRDEYVASPEFSSLGHKWRVDIYPGGVGHSAEGYVAIGLMNMSNKRIEIEYGYCVKDADGKEVVHKKPNTAKEFKAGTMHGCGHFAKRSKLIKSLENGTLVIEVRMRIVDTCKPTPLFIPQNPINKNVLELFDDEESADVVFEIGGHQDAGDNKRAKISTTNFHAHQIILKKCAPTLHEMCVSSDGEDVTSVPINGVQHEIFRHMLHYIYGGKISEEDLKENAKDIIDACDKYGVVGLKLEAEACYVNSTTITVDNMMDNLLYADSKNLALLKEGIMDYIVTNKKDIIGKISFDNVPGYMMTDLLTAVSRGEQHEGNSDDDEEDLLSTMRVSELRKKLDEDGLDVDGSREAMIARLKGQS